ncbi:MAG: Lin1244/Lin1753 domain-containing protein [Smithella sp.]
MTRPKKETVDYFSHDCEHGKTLFVLESQFGNDGYSFWFKLLETLGKTEGHSYNFNDPAARVFLLAKTRVNEETARSILSMLSDMEAIDRELWSTGIIWCQKFVDRLSDVYTRRKKEKPLRPTLTTGERDKCQQKPKSQNDNAVINPQIKVNESILNNTTTFVLPDWIPGETWKSYLAVRKKKKAADTVYALNLVISELQRIKQIHNHDPVDVLNKSITSGWADVYPLKNGNGNNSPPIKQSDPFTNCNSCGTRHYKNDLNEFGLCIKCENKQSEVAHA